ncbi:MAG: hypothetical protein U1E15_09415 [Hyphomicrobiales bacterium]
MKHLTPALCLFLAMAGTATAACKDDLAAVIDKHKSSGPYHVSMTTSATGGKVTKAEADVILPDKFHIMSPEMEMLLVGPKAWMKMGGDWQPMPGEAAQMMSSMIAAGMADGLKKASNITCPGTLDYEGESYTAYAFDMKANVMGMDSKSHVTLYADGDGLPARVVVNGEAAGMKTKTVQKLTFKSGISISPPN